MLASTSSRDGELNSKQASTPPPTPPAHTIEINHIKKDPWAIVSPTSEKGALSSRAVEGIERSRRMMEKVLKEQAEGAGDDKASR